MVSVKWDATGMCGRLVMMILTGRLVVESRKRCCSRSKNLVRDFPSHSSIVVSYIFITSKE